MTRTITKSGFRKARMTAIATLALAVSSCANFTSEASRTSTHVWPHGGNSILSELVGVDGDTLVIIPQDGRFRELGIHYSEIEKVILTNDASEAAAIAGGGLLGGVGGFFVGLGIGEAGSGEFSGLSGGLTGFAVGAVACSAVASYSTRDREYYIRERIDLEKLTKYCRYPNANELRMKRRR